jgi:manganese/zinc/iron transport system ATP- binding protein
MVQPLAVDVEGMHVSYGVNPVLWDIHLKIPQGQIVGIVGPNGAGKSTLLKALLSLVTPSSGTVQLLGADFSAVRHQVSYVPQRESVDWEFPIDVLSVVLMGCYAQLGLFRRPGQEQKERALQILEKLDLLPFAHRQISALSGGQKQRVFLARALMQNASLLLFDEPFSGIDMGSERKIMQVLYSLRDEGKTILIVHHDLTTAREYFDRLALINLRMVAEGPVEKILTKSYLQQAYGHHVSLFEEALQMSEYRQEGLFGMEGEKKER